MHWPLRQVNSLSVQGSPVEEVLQASSELPQQSVVPSQTAESGMQVPSSQVNCVSGSQPVEAPPSPPAPPNPVAVLTAPSGSRILDFGQNLVGRVRITVRGLVGASSERSPAAQSCTTSCSVARVG